MYALSLKLEPPASKAASSSSSSSGSAVPAEPISNPQDKKRIEELERQVQALKREAEDQKIVVEDVLAAYAPGKAETSEDESSLQNRDAEKVLQQITAQMIAERSLLVEMKIRHAEQVCQLQDSLARQTRALEQAKQRIQQLEEQLAQTPSRKSTSARH